MARTSKPEPTHPISSTANEAFADICTDAIRGLSDAVDLILIHNERDVRGRQPRATLNPLVLLESVAAWERLLADLRALALTTFSEPGESESVPGGAYLGPGERGTVRLAALTDGSLPDGFEVRVFEKWWGKRPTHPVTARGADVASYVKDAITHRNGVAHRSLPGVVGRAMVTSDAKAHTIQAGWARGVAALFIQLTDQVIVSAARTSGFTAPPRPPAQWFRADPGRLRGIEDPGALWGGHSLIRV